MSSVIKPARRRNGRAGPNGASGPGSGGAGASGAFGVAGRCLSLRKGMTLVAGLFFAAALVNTVTYLHSGRTLLESFSAAADSGAAAVGSEGGSLPNFALSSLLQLPTHLSTAPANVVETEEAEPVLEEPPPLPKAEEEEPKVRGW